jgi:hypothetical protein
LIFPALQAKPRTDPEIRTSVDAGVISDRLTLIRPHIPCTHIGM